MIRIRTIIFGAWLAVVTIAIGLVSAPFLIFGEGAARAGVKLWSRSALFALRAVCGVRHEIEGREHLPKGGAIVAVNHQSMWETIVFFTLLTRPVAVFKKELLRVPIYGWWGLLSGSTAVDRKAGAKAIRALSEWGALKIAEGCQVVVFPEGTRARVGESLPLQPGVAAIYKASDAPCTPAIHDSGRFWLFPGGLFSPKQPGVVRLTILPAIEPGLPRKEFQRRLEAALRPRPAAPPPAHERERAA